MRKARLTWQGALHHVMNRGINKQKIFFSVELKKKYIELMAEKSEKYKIRIFAYCVMDNHFHIVLENSSGKLSDFMKSLNGQYGQYYRKTTNSKGYVFEDRFKSTLVQDNKYLITLIMYVLLNPIRSGYVKNPFDYKWSSI
ncbi:MAG: transposase, partial [Acidobacteriota bacterium]